MKLRIGTRGSDLALWQARHVAQALAPEAEVEIVVLSTRGDTIDDVPLTGLEGKGFFTAELEAALRDGSIDLAVHSHKDLPVEAPEGLAIVAVTPRACAAERLLIDPAAHAPDAALLPLRRGVRVGTSAPRRAEQLLALRPDLIVGPLRGNVPTRVRKLREGRHDAVLLAAAGLDRLALDLSGLVVVELPPELLVPSPAQGALAVQGRDAASCPAPDAARAAEIAALCRRRLHDATTAAAVQAERELLARAGGGCNLPLGAHVGAAEAGRFAASAFLGADQPAPGRPARWARGQGRTARAAAQHALAALLGDGPTHCGPLGGLRVALAGLADDAQGSALGARLSTLGAAVRHEAVLRVVDLPAPELPERVASLRTGDVLALTSAQAARRLAGLALPPGVVVAAVGGATAAALARAGQRALVVGEGGARALVPLLPLRPGARVLHVCAEAPRPELARGVAARGATLHALPVYRTETAPAAAPAATDVAARIYMSPSAVRACVELRREARAGAARLAVGPSTAQALREAGLAQVERDEARADGAAGPVGVEALVAALHALHANASRSA